jgi:hypothetical protein
MKYNERKNNNLKEVRNVCMWLSIFDVKESLDLLANDYASWKTAFATVGWDIELEIQRKHATLIKIKDEKKPHTIHIVFGTHFNEMKISTNIFTKPNIVGPGSSTNAYNDFYSERNNWRLSEKSPDELNTALQCLQEWLEREQADLMLNLDSNLISKTATYSNENNETKKTYTGETTKKIVELMGCIPTEKCHVAGHTTAIKNTRQLFQDGILITSEKYHPQPGVAIRYASTFFHTREPAAIELENESMVFYCREKEDLKQFDAWVLEKQMCLDKLKNKILLELQSEFKGEEFTIGEYGIIHQIGTDKNEYYNLGWSLYRSEAEFYQTLQLNQNERSMTKDIQPYLNDQVGISIKKKNILQTLLTLFQEKAGDITFKWHSFDRLDIEAMGEIFKFQILVLEDDSETEKEKYEFKNNNKVILKTEDLDEINKVIPIYEQHIIENRIARLYE